VARPEQNRPFNSMTAFFSRAERRLHSLQQCSWRIWSPPIPFLSTHHPYRIAGERHFLGIGLIETHCR
jgi:hypothetical protein